MDQVKPHITRNKFLYILTGSLLLIGLITFIYIWFWGRFDEYTDDSYVSGNLVYITPQVTGIVTGVYADNTQNVAKDQILVELDKTDFIIALNESKALLGKSIRDVAELFTEAEQKKAMIAAYKAEFKKNAADYERRTDLVALGSVSAEDFSHIETALVYSYFLLAASEQEYFSALMQVSKVTVRTHPIVLNAKEHVKKAWVALSRCTLKAPVGGLVAKRSAQVGARVNASDPVLAVIPLEQMWVDANFKETQIGKMQIGQRATVTADIYGNSVVYAGTVIGIGGGTGSVFSILPPQNATGNWIKIVQRVPVRISLAIEDLKDHPLRLGLSTEVHVDIHSIDTSPIPKVQAEKPLYQTNVFADEESGVSEVIEQIFRQNLPSL